MATMKTPSFSRWWRAIKRKTPEEQVEIFTKWLHYGCKTIANRGDQNQQRFVYTVATRYNKSKYKRMPRHRARIVYMIINQKQFAHKKAMAEIKELKQQIFDLQSQLTNMVKNPNNTKITTKKTRKVIAHGGQRQC